MPTSPRWLAVFLVSSLGMLLSPLHGAQSNQVPGLDIMLSRLRSLTAIGRQGVFPDGMNGVALETTVCNEGTVEVPWSAPMSTAHPKIAFLVASVRNGRIEQISDRSFLKHGFFAANAEGCNLPCDPGLSGAFLSLGCSDTYQVAHNGDSYYLGPAEEVNPWLGTWTKTCSHFDRGSPPVAAPFDCDGKRSLTTAQAQALGPVANRIHLRDQDLLTAGALCYQGQYVVEGLPEAARDDSLGSRTFTASWSGSSWTLATTGVLQPGSILQRWTGASLASNTNGGDDGRLFVAVLVTGPVGGFYHYEYALHNRDNARGVGALHVPLCSGARVRNLGFRDLDQLAANDWTATVGANEVTFAGTSPALWNTITNFWFDSDAGPESSALQLDQSQPGPGLASVSVPSSAPLGLYNAYLGAGCANDTPPTLFATGTPARATLGNSTFTLQSAGNAALQPSALRFSLANGSFALRGCTFYLGASPLDVGPVATVTADAAGLAVFSVPIPNDLALEGLDVNLQTLARDPGNGRLFTNFELSDGLRVRVGNAVVSCP